jgi:hypothetical protein
MGAHAGQGFKVARLVAVTVDGAAKAAGLEGSNEIIEVFIDVPFFILLL